MARIVMGALAAFALAAAFPLHASTDGKDLPADLPLNRLQVVGTHNSYSLPLDPRLTDLVAPLINEQMQRLTTHMPPKAAELFREEHPNEVMFSEVLNYRHDDLRSQLDLGLRSLELDVHPDPEGGHYLDPAGYRLLKERGATDLAPIDTAALAQPGYKVFHMPDVDFRSHCTLFRTCLEQIRGWSDANPGHVPLFILIEAKVQAAPIFAGATVPIPFDKQRFDELDHEILSVFGRGRIITPDDVRGDFPTLNAAVRMGHWPTLAKARGKVLFLMLTASGDAGTRPYLEGHPSLSGRVAFLRAQPGEDHAAFLMYDNALMRSQEIARAVAEGYLVRTRSDIETYEAKVNDRTRADAALASGAQIVSTDFPKPGNSYGTAYTVGLPGGASARVSPAFTR